MKQTFSDTKNDEQINDLNKKNEWKLVFFCIFFVFFIKVSDSVKVKRI